MEKMRVFSIKRSHRGWAGSLCLLLAGGPLAAQEAAPPAGAEGSVKPAALSVESPAPDAPETGDTAETGAGDQSPAETGTAAGDDEVLEMIEIGRGPYADDPAFAGEVPADEPIELPRVAETPEDRLRELFRLYRDAVNDGMYAEADTLAKRIVELTIEIHGLDSEEASRAITNLAIAQHGAGDYESALLNFQSSIDIIERNKDRLNKDLINPLKGMAAAQLALGQPSRATETYNRAVHVSHVNYGPHNLEQVETLEALAETYLAAGLFDEAVDMQQRVFALQARNISMDSLEILPALHNQARWLHRLQLYDRERYTWRRVVSVLEDHRGDEDLSLIEPLTSLGRSYLYFSPQEINYHMPASNTTGEIYLKRALRIAEENPDADWRTHADAILALGDYYIMTEKPNRAERSYRDAWELLSGGEERERFRDEQLQSLVFLNDARPPKFAGLDAQPAIARRPDGFETGTIVYSYSLSTRGSLRDLELVEADPRGFADMAESVERELRRAVQRPRVVDGQTVHTENLQFSHSFYYRPGDIPETVTAAEDTPE